MDKVFTSREIKLCEQKQSQVQSFAARFAGKEACLKAFGSGWAEGLSFRDIEIMNNAKGAPEIILYGKSREKAAELGVTKIHVTLSHLKEIAFATVILEK